MTDQPPIGVGIIGLGFMGRTHAAAYAAANEAGYPNRLVAVYDKLHTPSSVAKGNLELSTENAKLFEDERLRHHASPAALLADPEVELVSICTPTDSHVDLAIAALEAGKHVLVEKPVALSSTEVERLADAARAATTLCMPAMCIRFWPGWNWLEQAIKLGTYGAVRSAVFRRLASPPTWSPEFYKDATRTGGALFDLHVHDVDFIRWCFGAPDSVLSTGSVNHVTSVYRYANGPEHVVAEGGWIAPDEGDFLMRYTVVFEHATADYESGREHPLQLVRDGARDPIDLEPGTGYDGEIRHFLQACRSESPRLTATIDDAVELTRLIEAERDSLS